MKRLGDRLKKEPKDKMCIRDRSLPEECNYTTRGLASICKEGVDAIDVYKRQPPDRPRLAASAKIVTM